MIPSGYPEVFATFAVLQQLRTVRGTGSADCPVASAARGLAVLVVCSCRRSSLCVVIGAASRAGSALCTAELLAMLTIGLVRLRDPETGLPTRPTTAMLLMVPVLAAAFTLAVGWERVWLRFQQNDPYLVRREFLLAAADMAKHRPLIGYGLGTFPEVYQRYAIRDFPLYVNHAHNDWAEFAADGGFPFLLLVLIPFAAVVPAAVRNPWGLGLIAIMLHACVDFPFLHPGVPGWMFVLLALLYRSRIPDETMPRKPKPAIADGAPALESV